MNYKMIGRLMSLIVISEALFMVPAWLISLANGEDEAAWAFLATMAVALFCGMIGYAICSDAERRFYAREGLVSSGIGWLLMSFVGCFPYILSGTIPSFINAFFESVSGFTTTGASVLVDIEAAPMGILYWRSFTQWLGGMGVMVFLLAVIPASGKGNGFTMHLLRAESPGPNVSKLVPRMRKTATILYVLYVVLTILCFLFLIAGKMDVFDAVCTAYATAGTGGFGVKNDSMASYSVYLQNVCAVFMALFGVNFACYYMILIGKIRDVLRDEELRLYLLLIFSSIGLIMLNTRSSFVTLGDCFHNVAFQVVSILTSSGFTTVDYDAWPTFAQAILLMLMFCGASAGSTSGGFKCGRVLLLFKSLHRNLQRTLSPQKVLVVRNNGQVVSEKVIDKLNTYLAAYVLIILFSFLAICLDGKGMTTTITSVVACFNNTGPGLAGVGPLYNYLDFSIFSKVVLIFDMLAGRLEIFPIMLLLTKNTWKRLG